MIRELMQNADGLHTQAETLAFMVYAQMCSITGRGKSDFRGTDAACHCTD